MPSFIAGGIIGEYNIYVGGVGTIVERSTNLLQLLRDDDFAGIRICPTVICVRTRGEGGRIVWK